MKISVLPDVNNIRKLLCNVMVELLQLVWHILVVSIPSMQVFVTFMWKSRNFIPEENG